VPGYPVTPNPQNMRPHIELEILDFSACLRPAFAKTFLNELLIRRNSLNLTGDTGQGKSRLLEDVKRMETSLGMPVAPLDISAFEPHAVDLPAGDLARMLGRETSLGDKGETLLEARPPLTPIQPRAEEDPGKKWIPGTEPQVTENPDKPAKVVVFRDSFAIALMKFLGCSFNRVVYVWQQNWDKRIIEREKPDIVIDEMLERFVITRSPSELRVKDEQPDAQVFGGR